MIDRCITRFRHLWVPIAMAGLPACEPKPVEVPDADPDPRTERSEPATLLWQTEIHGYDGFGQGITPQPLPDGSVAYIHDGDSATVLYHLDRDDGRVLDSFPVALPQAPAGEFTFPYLQGFEGTDLLAAYDAYVVRLDLTDGSFKWASAEAYDYTPAWQPGRYLIGPFSAEGEAPRVYEFDLRTGTPKVIVEIPSLSARSQTSIINPRVLTVGEGREILTAYHKSIDWSEAPGYPDHGYIAGYDLTDGRELWRMPLGQAAGAESSSIHGDRLIQVVADTVYSLNPVSGAVDWRYWIGKAGDRPAGRDVGGEFSEVNPLVDTALGYVYLGTKDRLVACVDLETGEQIWAREHAGGRMFLQDQGAGMITVLGTDFETYLLDKRTGDLLAKLEQRTRGSVAQTGAYYDSATRRVYLYDGARAYCYQLNFEPPGA